MNDVLVCSSVAYFADDVQARCAHCDASIVHRPHVPPGLVTLCMTCAAKDIATSTTEPEFRLSEETRRELALYYAKPKGTA